MALQRYTLTGWRTIKPITLLTTQIGDLYWGKDYFSDIKNTTVQALEQQGFGVTSVGDVPNDLSGYSLVVFEAWFAVEPKISKLVRDYLTNNCNVTIIDGIPWYFSTYCKDMWPNYMAVITLLPCRTGSAALNS